MRSNQVRIPALKDESNQEFHGFIYTNKILCEVTFRMMTHYSLRIWPGIIFLQRKWRLFQMAKRRSALHRMMFISRQPKSSGPDVHSTTNPKMMRFKKKGLCSLKVVFAPSLWSSPIGRVLTISPISILRVFAWPPNTGERCWNFHSPGQRVHFWCGWYVVGGSQMGFNDELWRSWPED